jgi:hypothetical protein
LQYPADSLEEETADVINEKILQQDITLPGDTTESKMAAVQTTRLL